MRANIMSDWLCATAGAAEELVTVDGADDDVASLVAELLHAPRVATAASAATPLNTILALVTTHPLRLVRHFDPMSSLPGLGRGGLVVL